MLAGQTATQDADGWLGVGQVSTARSTCRKRRQPKCSVIAVLHVQLAVQVKDVTFMQGIAALCTPACYTA